MSPIVRIRGTGDALHGLRRGRTMASSDQGNVELQHLGETFTATWKVQHGVVSVTHTDEDGIVSEVEAPAGSIRPSALARLLLSEIVAGVIVRRSRKPR